MDAQLLDQANALTPSQRVELLEAAMLCFDQVEIPLNHTFAHGVYMRHGELPKGTLLIGMEHRTDHLNVLLSGQITVLMDGERTVFKAPCVFGARAGVRKVIRADEDSVLANIHGTQTTDIDAIEAELVIESETGRLHRVGQKSDLMLLAENLLANGVALEQIGG